VPYKLLADFPLVDIERRLEKVIDTVITQALAAAGFSARDCSEVALFIGSSSFDISVSEYAYQQAQKIRGDSIRLEVLHHLAILPKPCAGALVFTERILVSTQLAPAARTRCGTHPD
jgi:hypothetical protein